jgi:uncharacterized repeat protein (TIGR01451 family)
LARLVTLLVLLIAVAGILPAPVAHAAAMRTINVDPIDDDDPIGGCTLREALDVANAGGGAGHHLNGCKVTERMDMLPLPEVYILNLPAYTYTLTGAAGEDNNESGDLDVEANVAFQGQGAKATIISGAGIDRVLHVNPDGLGDLSVRLSGLTVTKGSTDGNGGGIYNNAATLYIDESILHNNEGTDAFSYGGAIYNGGGTLTITASTLYGNKTGRSGGGVRNSDGGSLEITDSTLSGNEAGWGGGILSEYSCTLAISESTFSGNRAVNGGGGIDASGLTTISHSVFEDNRATGVNSFGGGIAATGDTMTITHSTVYSNSAELAGGGIYVGWDATLTLSNTTLSGNHAVKWGGGLRLNTGVATIANSTISGNWAASGGGILAALDTTVDLTQVTITDNTANAAEGGDDQGGGLYSSETVTATNTIIAGNHDLSGTDTDDCALEGTYTSGGHNLVGTGTGCPTTGTGDQASADPGLGPLADNGGETQTHALLAASPAIEAVPVVSCTLTTDQRDVSRPQGAACDSGAYELDHPYLAIAKGVMPDTDVALQGTVTYTIGLSNSSPISGTGVLLSDTLPADVSFSHWVVSPTGVSYDPGPPEAITWTGTISGGQALTFTFVVSHTGAPGNIVTNTAEYDHASGTGTDEATFTVRPTVYTYLPLVMKDH